MVALVNSINSRAGNNSNRVVVHPTVVLPAWILSVSAKLQAKVAVLPMPVAMPMNFVLKRPVRLVQKAMAATASKVRVATVTANNRVAAIRIRLSKVALARAITSIPKVIALAENSRAVSVVSKEIKTVISRGMRMASLPVSKIAEYFA